MHQAARRSLRWFTGLLLLVGCSDDIAPTMTGEPGLRFVAGANQSDTIGAKLQPITLAYYGADGRPRAGVPITLTGPFLHKVDTTDAGGRVGFAIDLGCYAGDMTLRARLAADSAVADSARFTVLHGAVVRLSVEPPDTIVYIGKTFAPRPAWVDRCGNRFALPAVTYATTSNNKLGVEGTALRGRALGRAEVIARSGSYADTLLVSVVPEAVFAAIAVRNDIIFELGVPEVLVAETNGTILRNYRWPLPPGFYPPATFAVTPGAATLYLAADGKIWMTGVAPQWIALPAPAGTAGMYQPALTRDGTRLFLAARPAGIQGLRLFEARPDGTQPRLLRQDTVWWHSDYAPTPAPDGSRLLYLAVRNDGITMTSTMRILDLATGADTDLGISAERAVWSPEGSRIAYINGGEIWIIDADGSNAVRMSPPGRLYNARLNGYPQGLDWSANGQWLIAQQWDGPGSGSGTLDIIEVATGEFLPLPYTREWEWSAPIWIQ